MYCACRTVYSLWVSSHRLFYRVPDLLGIFLEEDGLADQGTGRRRLIRIQRLHLQVFEARSAEHLWAWYSRSNRGWGQLAGSGQTSQPWMVGQNSRLLTMHYFFDHPPVALGARWWLWRGIERLLAGLARRGSVKHRPSLWAGVRQWKDTANLSQLLQHKASPTFRGVVAIQNLASIWWQAEK